MVLNPKSRAAVLMSASLGLCFLYGSLLGLDSVSPFAVRLPLMVLGGLFSLVVLGGLYVVGVAIASRIPACRNGRCLAFVIAIPLFLLPLAMGHSIYKKTATYQFRALLGIDLPRSVSNLTYHVSAPMNNVSLAFDVSQDDAQLIMSQARMNMPIKVDAMLDLNLVDDMDFQFRGNRMVVTVSCEDF